MLTAKLMLREAPPPTSQRAKILQTQGGFGLAQERPKPVASFSTPLQRSPLPKTGFTETADDQEANRDGPVVSSPRDVLWDCARRLRKGVGQGGCRALAPFSTRPTRQWEPLWAEPENPGDLATSLSSDLKATFLRFAQVTANSSGSLGRYAWSF